MKVFVQDEAISSGKTRPVFRNIMAQVAKAKKVGVLDSQDSTQIEFDEGDSETAAVVLAVLKTYLLPSRLNDVKMLLALP